MRKRILVICLMSGCFGCCQTNYYVVRHAEKATSPANNPPLTVEGQQRAERLKTWLLPKQIKAIYSTQTLRTESTAKPLAQHLNLPIISYNATDQAAFIEQLKRSRKNTLIVGHSNTLRHVVNGLYERDTLHTDLDEKEYGNLFVVRRRHFPKQIGFEHHRF